LPLVTTTATPPLPPPAPPPVPPEKVVPDEAGPVVPLEGDEDPAPPAPLVAVTVGESVAVPEVPDVPPVAVAVAVAGPEVATPEVVDLLVASPENPPAPVPPLADTPVPVPWPLPPVGPETAGAAVVGGVAAGAESRLRAAASARLTSRPDMAGDGT
ncbi:MAG: hypothetical protein M3083_14950, partial [Actinomycetota bacterium]|nr:hypothetical protein [Actinomycetota bacterium]